MFNTCVTAVKTLNAIKGKVEEWRDILTVLIDAILRCPAFFASQKKKIVKLAGGLGFVQHVPTKVSTTYFAVMRTSELNGLHMVEMNRPSTFSILNLLRVELLSRPLSLSLPYLPTTLDVGSHSSNNLLLASIGNTSKSNPTWSSIRLHLPLEEDLAILQLPTLSSRFFKLLNSYVYLLTPQLVHPFLLAPTFSILPLLLAQLNSLRALSATLPLVNVVVAQSLVGSTSTLRS